MVQSLKVILWGEEIGRLAWDARRRLSYFMYNPVFLKKGLNISPLAAPVDGARGLTPVWGEEAKIYQKLPAFLADSLPCLLLLYRKPIIDLGLPVMSGAA